ncbi:MucR family transcriptional regulator [Acetobacter okinawensis]|uniref:MucR family transcriptional regulator n=1 Tax=Acetobacter okinawensis TaxID=1076594 RepID=UPI001BA7662D|nr:MucR family transcriptional regulator [Acetobacter okinawensis]MBS0967167.1 MucR family transcriptional regulator [Acetobacter okinawensis]
MSSDKDIILGRLNAVAQIVTAHLATTKVGTEQLPELVRRLYTSLSGVEHAAGSAGTLSPVTTETLAPQPGTTEQSVAAEKAVEVEAPPVAAPIQIKQPQQPAVPVKESVFPDYIICLEDGKKLKSLKRHLTSVFGMTIDDYKTKWGLPAEYPTVAPNYAELRRNVAKKIGLGKRTGQAEDIVEDGASPDRPVEKKRAASSRNVARKDKSERVGGKGDEHRLANAFVR